MRSLIVLAGLLAGCPGTLQDPNRFKVDCVATDVPAKILTPRCGDAKCHSSIDHAAGLDLISPGLSARLVGVAARGGAGLLIDPDNPDGSVLVRKLTPQPPFLAQQPPGAPLDPASIDCIRRWVRLVSVLPANDGGS